MLDTVACGCGDLQTWVRNWSEASLELKAIQCPSCDTIECAILSKKNIALNNKVSDRTH